MPDDKKADPKPIDPQQQPQQQQPQQPNTAVVPTIPQATPAPAPPPVETPPGGKFGVRDVEIKDGKPVETVRYVNAFGLPFHEDPEENLKERMQDRSRGK